MNKLNITTGAVSIFIIGIFLGIGGEFLYVTKKLGPEIAQNGALQSKVNDLTKTNIDFSNEIDAAKAYFTRSAGSDFLTATVTKIEGNVITVKPPEVATPFPDRSLALRAVTITSSTTIVLRIPKSQDEYLKEINEAQGIMTSHAAAGVTEPALPKNYTEKSASLADIVPGAKLAIEAGENISALAEFTATKISILPAATQ